MNTPQAPLPATLSRPEPASLDLDERILRIEQRLIARDENLRSRFGALRRRVGQALQPRRLLVGAAGGLLALGGLWWLLRGRGGKRAPLRAARMAASEVASGADAGGVSSAAPRRGGELPWVQLLGLAWPLLPERWRQRVSPATASTVLTLGLPLLEKLFAWRRAQPCTDQPHTRCTPRRNATCRACRRDAPPGKGAARCAPGA